MRDMQAHAGIFAVATAIAQSPDRCRNFPIDTTPGEAEHPVLHLVRGLFLVGHHNMTANTMRLPSKRQYERVLRSGALSEAQLRALQAIYNFPEHSATAPQLAAVLGYMGFGGANLVIGGAGKRFSEELGIAPPGADDKRNNWFGIIAGAVGTDIGCLWIMHPALVSALEEIKLVDPSLGVELFPDENAGHTKHEEGSRFRIDVNIYERSREARKKCVSHYGPRCSVCKFDFEAVYGAIGKDFIHVHHLVPLSEITKSYVVDPVRDLRPVCPNCHAIIHRRVPAFSISEIINLIKQ
jgi:predicted HNH restriction endonuclease